MESLIYASLVILKKDGRKVRKINDMGYRIEKRNITIEIMKGLDYKQVKHIIEKEIVPPLKRKINVKTKIGLLDKVVKQEPLLVVH